MELTALISRNNPALFDGAMGTQLEAAGLEMGGQTNLTHPDEVRAVHRGYVKAGCDLLITNTLTMNRVYIESHKLDVDVREVNLTGVRLARSEAQEGMPVLGDMSSTGRMLEPYGDCTESQARDSFCEQARCLAEGGVDGFIVETVLDLKEALIAVRACKEAAPLPVIVTLAFQTPERGGRTIMGNSAAECAVALAAEGADVVGANCGDVSPRAMSEIVARMRAETSLPLAAQPNAGVPRLIGGRTSFDMGAKEFADGIEECLRAGAAFVGGCCGTTPQHIKCVRKRIIASG
jgi:5-methyltetrahydrofolate--homocysteine methyltransferase